MLKKFTKMEKVHEFKTSSFFQQVKWKECKYENSLWIWEKIGFFLVSLNKRSSIFKKVQRILKKFIEFDFFYQIWKSSTDLEKVHQIWKNVHRIWKKFIES